MNINVVAAVEQAQRNLQRVSRELEKMGTASERADAKMRRSAQRMVDTGKKLTTRLTLPIVAGFGFAVKAASDLNEALDANRVIFGEAAEGAEEWAKTMAKSAGLSAKEALGASAAFGNMLKTVGVLPQEGVKMSKTLVQLAGDMASFSNEDPSAMLERLRSGLSGEAEPLRRFGVLISAARVEAKALELGLAGANGEISEAAKVQARYAIILEDSNVQQGNFTLTADSVANKMRTAKSEAQNAAATFGDALLPITQKLLGALSSLAQGFGKLPEPVQKAIAVIAGVAALAGPILIVVGKLRLMQLELRKARVEAGFAGGAFRKMGVALKVAGIIATATAISSALDDMLHRDKINRANAWSSAFVGALGEGEDAAKRIREEIEKLQGAAGKDFPAIVQGFEPAFGGRDTDALKQMGLSAKEAHARIAVLKDELHRLESSQEGVTAATQGTTRAVKTLTKEAVTFAGMTGEAFDKWRDGTLDAINPADDALSKLAQQAKTTSSQILKSFTDQLSKLRDYGANWERLVARGLPDSLAKQLQEMGIEGAGVVKALAGANDKQFERIIKKWQKAQSTSKRIGDAIERNLSKEVEVPISFVPGKGLVMDGKVVDIPFFHHGGTFRAPTPGGEGLAVLRDGERVLTPQQQNTHGSAPSVTFQSGAITINAAGGDLSDPRVIDAISREIGRRAALAGRTA